MTDSELIEHMHARGWRTEAIDVPMIREACKALQASASAEPVQPPYPEGVVFGPCVCGSWPGGECLKCQWIASPVTAAREQEAGATGAAIAALRYWRDECSGAEPSISVFERMVDEALATPTTYRVRDEALDCLTMIRDWPVDQWQDWQLATRTMAAMARKALERAAEEQIE